MKNTIFTLALLPVLCLADMPDFIRISSENPRYLCHANGSAFIPVGPNICFERFETNEEKVLALYDGRFAKLAANGGNYTRVWLSAPFFEVEHEKAGVYDEAVARRIDRLMASAARHGIRVKFCLENFRKLTGYPSPFHGAVPFEKPIYAASNGGPLQSLEDLSKPAGKDLYRKRVEFLAARYADNPNVFAWELWNEMNTVGLKGGIHGVYDWTAEMIPEIRSLCPRQMVCQSLGSCDSAEQIRNYKLFAGMEVNDLAQIHRYLDPGAPLAACRGPMDVLASDAVRFLRACVKNRPVILAETGAVESRHSGPSKLYPLDTQGILLHDVLFAPFFSGAAAAGQCWHWQLYIEKNDLWWHYGRFTRAIAGADPIQERFEPAFFTLDGVRFYCLKGRTQTLVWCRDAQSDWKTELVEKQTPASRHVTVPLRLFRPGAKSFVQYDPWQDTQKSLPVSADSVTFDFTRSTVLRFPATP